MSQDNTLDHIQDMPLNPNDSLINEADNAASTEITAEMQSFYQRADAIIGVANSQLGTDAHSGQVGASLLYAAARYSASVASIGFIKGDDFAKEKDDIVEFYVKQYRQMLSDNLTDYAQNFDKYINIDKQS